MLQAVPFSFLCVAPLRIVRAQPSPFPKMLSWLSSPTNAPVNQSPPATEIQRAGNAEGFYRQVRKLMTFTKKYKDADVDALVAAFQGDRAPAALYKKCGSAAAYYGSTAMDNHAPPGAEELNTFLKLQQQRVRGEGTITVVLGNEAAGAVLIPRAHRVTEDNGSHTDKRLPQHASCLGGTLAPIIFCCLLMDIEQANFHARVSAWGR